MQGSRQLYLLSDSSHSKTNTKSENLSLSNDSSCTRVARDELVLEPDKKSLTSKSLKHKTGRKEVTVAPSVFSGKETASDGPDIAQPVVIPAVKPTLDHSLLI